jgi:hypothetical protein
MQCGKLKSIGLDYRLQITKRGLEHFSYKGALLSILLHATVYVYTQFAECTGTELGIGDHYCSRVQAQFTVSQELVWLRYGDTSATQRTGKVRRWKPLTEGWWSDSRSQRVSACCSELENVWIGDSDIVNCLVRFEASRRRRLWRMPSFGI